MYNHTIQILNKAKQGRFFLYSPKTLMQVLVISKRQFQMNDSDIDYSNPMFVAVYQYSTDSLYFPFLSLKITAPHTPLHTD
jgi:hypothetical protein